MTAMRGGVWPIPKVTGLQNEMKAFRVLLDERGALGGSEGATSALPEMSKKVSEAKQRMSHLEKLEKRLIDSVNNPPETMQPAAIISPEVKLLIEEHDAEKSRQRAQLVLLQQKHQVANAKAEATEARLSERKLLANVAAQYKVHGGLVVTFDRSIGPLGLSLKPDHVTRGGLGAIITGIDKGGQAALAGGINGGDRISHINGTDVKATPFASIREHITSAQIVSFNILPAEPTVPETNLLSVVAATAKLADSSPSTTGKGTAGARIAVEYQSKKALPTGSDPEGEDTPAVFTAAGDETIVAEEQHSEEVPPGESGSEGEDTPAAVTAAGEEESPYGDVRKLQGLLKSSTRSQPLRHATITSTISLESDEADALGDRGSKPEAITTADRPASGAAEAAPSGPRLERPVSVISDAADSDEEPWWMGLAGEKSAEKTTVQATSPMMDLVNSIAGPGDITEMDARRGDETAADQQPPPTQSDDGSTKMPSNTEADERNNKLETMTAADLDGDGDIGFLGSPNKPVDYSSKGTADGNGPDLTYTVAESDSEPSDYDD